MKKRLAFVLITTLSLSALTGCGSNNEPASGDDQGSGTIKTESNFDPSSALSVISREDGSGTRGAFIELMGIEIKGDDGSKTDKTTPEAIIASKTDIMMNNVASNPYAIGYISLGSLSDTVKAVQVDGVDATAENVQNGTYPVARPFNIVTKDSVSQVAQDFIRYILSAEGQAIITDNGYIAIDDTAPSYAVAGLEGKVTVGGSSSVSPVMEKLQEAYLALNPNVTIEIQTNDSTAGVASAIDGTCDIGMASRELKESEAAEVTGTVIALDGIAVVVNNENPITSLTAEQIMNIFIGEVINWDEVA